MYTPQENKQPAARWYSALDPEPDAIREERLSAERVRRWDEEPEYQHEESAEPLRCAHYPERY